VVSGAAGVVSGAAGVVSGAAGLVLGAEVVTVVDPGESTAVTASIRLTNGECIGAGLGAAEAVGVCSEVFKEVLLFFPLLGPMVKVYSSSDVFSSRSLEAKWSGERRTAIYMGGAGGESEPT